MTLETIVILGAVLLIPLVPALIIYLLLPSKTAVKGPFKGLQINLQGAFGGYFLMVLLSFGIVESILPDRNKYPKYEEYSIFGSIDFDGPELADLDTRLVQLYMYPRVENISQIGQNHFEWVGKIPMRRDFNNALSFPYERIIIEYPGFSARQIDLRSGAIQDGSRKVTFEPVLMKPRPRGPLRTVELTNAQ